MNRLEQRQQNAAMLAERRRAATHCKRGHEFTPANTITRSNGSRNCLICQTDRAWYAYRGIRWAR